MKIVNIVRCATYSFWLDSGALCGEDEQQRIAQPGPEEEDAVAEHTHAGGYHAQPCLLQGDCAQAPAVRYQGHHIAAEEGRRGGGGKSEKEEVVV